MELYGNIGTNFLLFTFLSLYLCMYVCVFVCRMDTGRELGVQQDVQNTTRMSWERLVYVQIVGCVKGRYIYLVLIVDLKWHLL